MKTRSLEAAGTFPLAGWLLGPELFWFGAWALASALATANQPPTATGNTILEWSCSLLPLLAIPLCAWTFRRRGAAQRRLLGLRTRTATFIGLNAALIALIDGIDYGDSRNAGVLGFWMIGLLVGGATYVATAAARRFIERRAARTRHS